MGRSVKIHIPSLIVVMMMTVTLDPVVAAADKLLKDPMRPPNYVMMSGGTIDAQVSKLELHTTYVSEKSTYAVINNQLVREGETINNYSIVSIKSGIVVLDRDGEAMELSVMPVGLKKHTQRQSDD